MMNDSCNTQCPNTVNQFVDAHTKKYIGDPVVSQHSPIIQNAYDFHKDNFHIDSLEWFTNDRYGHPSQEYIQWRPDLFEAQGATRTSIILLEPHAQTPSTFQLKIESASDLLIEKIVIIVGARSHLSLMIDQNISHDATVILAIDIIVDAHASLDLLTLNTGSLWSKQQIAVHMRQEGGRADVRSLVALNGHQKSSFTSEQHHYAPRATSNVKVKSILAEHSQFLYQGKIVVDKRAENTQASQQNKNILWSSLARAWAIPSLEVKTNHVTCNHGTATGQLDEEQLFYLQSRGIQYLDAVQLLLQGFIADVLEQVPDSYVCDPREQTWDRLLDDIPAKECNKKAVIARVMKKVVGA